MDKTELAEKLTAYVAATQQGGKLAHYSALVEEARKTLKQHDDEDSNTFTLDELIEAADFAAWATADSIRHATQHIPEDEREDRINKMLALSAETILALLSTLAPEHDFTNYVTRMLAASHEAYGTLADGYALLKDTGDI